ncbi:hypothetical protein BDR07DRAFT_1411710 [Suillus spraguei]|nr:hypothetical protein BDR07DRAFT_1411710 [Suillus spraguei]
MHQAYSDPIWYLLLFFSKNNHSESFKPWNHFPIHACIFNNKPRVKESSCPCLVWVMLYNFQALIIFNLSDAHLSCDNVKPHQHIFDIQISSTPTVVIFTKTLSGRRAIM